MAEEIIVESPRLKLVMWDKGDAGLIRQLHSTVEMTRYLVDSEPWQQDTCEERLQSWIVEHARDGCTKYKLMTRDGNRFVGLAGFSFFGGDIGQFVLGYSIDRAEWGKGYATEIAAALAQWFFQAALAPRFVAFALAQNLPSLRVLEKIGMTGRPPITHNGVVCPAYEMSR